MNGVNQNSPRVLTRIRTKLDWCSESAEHAPINREPRLKVQYSVGVGHVSVPGRKYVSSAVGSDEYPSTSPRRKLGTSTSSSKERELLGQRAGITFDVCRKPTTSIFFFSKNFKIAPKTQVIPART